MTDPTRLVERGATKVELALLRAGVTDEPSRGSVQRAAAALGLAVGVGVTAPGAVAASTAGEAGLWTALKLVGAGLLVAGGLALGASQLASREDPSYDRTLAPNAEQPGVIPAAQPPGPVESADRAGLAAVAPTGGPTPAFPPAATKLKPAARSDPAPGEGASIREQTAMIDAARRQLAAQRPAAALRLLDTYQSRFPRGMLAQEATLLRVEALAQGGNRAQARELARKLLKRHPNSQYASRLAPLVGGESEGSSAVPAEAR